MSKIVRALCASSAVLIAACKSNDLVCGPDTRRIEGQCIAEAPEPPCGAGTVARSGECVAESEVSCGDGTHIESTKCVPNYLETTCGSGTHLDNGACLPNYSETTCGSGTHLDNGACELDQPARACGIGTTDVAGVCVPNDPIMSCGPGTILTGDTCVSPSVQVVAMPFPVGVSSEINQTINGQSHNGMGAHAVDFLATEGTQIAAARSGRVVDVREDSNTGCANINCSNDANYIIVDHGDNTFASYLHLRQDGVFVEVGDSICKGQIIGETGNTGFSFAPHLHFEVRDVWGYSLPLYIEELATTSAGVPVSGLLLSSDNETPANCSESHAYSDCPADAFLHRGIRLDAPFPCAVASLDQAYALSGTVVGQGAWVQVGVYRFASQSWDLWCVAVDGLGNFSATVTWDAVNHSGRSYFIVSAAYEDCTPYSTWYTSPRINLVAP